eukprot:5858970-Amphidinium_carterae.1
MDASRIEFAQNSPTFPGGRRFHIRQQPTSRKRLPKVMQQCNAIYVWPAPDFSWGFRAIVHRGN